MEDCFTFKSTEIAVIPGEDKETNPFRFGKSLATWISDYLNTIGYCTEVCAEDWGWRIACLSNPYPIWIGCGNMEESDDKGNYKEPDINDLTWQCFISEDKPFIKSLFKKLDASNEREALINKVKALLESTDHINILEKDNV